MRKSVVFIVIAGLLFLIVAGMMAIGYIKLAGPFLILFFVALAIAFRSFADLKGYGYTLVILASVTAALYYPHYFIEWNGFKLSVLITPLIQLIMFGMGTSMGIKDFEGVIRTPRGVFIGVTSHFIIMPLLGFTLANLSGFSAEIAAGIILVGCSPNGMASNVISYLAKANLALSITITAISTMLAPFLTPLLMKLLANSFIEINAWQMMWDITKMVLIPISAGLLFNRFFSGKFRWLDEAMPLLSMFGITFSIMVIIAAGRDNLLTIGPLLLALLLIHNLSGYFLGYWFARVCKMSEKDCRTVAIEVGMQNAGLATGIAKSMGKLATVGLAPAIFGSMMNVTGSMLASWWHKKDPEHTRKNRSPENNKVDASETVTLKAT